MTNRQTDRQTINMWMDGYIDDIDDIDLGSQTGFYYYYYYLGDKNNLLSLASRGSFL